MALPDPLEIIWGEFSVGGDTPYLLSNAHVVERSFTNFRFVAEVIVTVSQTADAVAGRKELLERSTALELAWSQRDLGLEIRMDGESVKFEFGVGVLATTSTCTKSGDIQKDRGLSRAYTISVEGQTAQSGIRLQNTAVEYTAARQRRVTISGVYTGGNASGKYQSQAPALASTTLDFIDSSAAWELVEENYDYDRKNHWCEFRIVFLELIADQSNSGRNHQLIKNHQISMSEIATHPGDSQEDVRPLRTVAAVYEASVDVTKSQDLRSAWNDIVRPHLVSLFESEYSPKSFALEQESFEHEPTTNTFRASCNFLFQAKSQGSDSPIVAVRKSLTYREHHEIGRTPLHAGGPYKANTFQGFATRQRIWRRTITVVGSEFPKKRIGESPGAGPAGLFLEALDGETDQLDRGGRTTIVQDGWNITDNESTATNEWRGNPQDGQFLVSILEELVVEEYTESAGAGGSGGPVSPGNLS